MLVLLHIFMFCFVMREASYCLFLRHQADVIEAFNSTSRYLFDLLNTDNTYFKQMVGHIYPTELQLNKVNAFDTEEPYLDDLHFSVSCDIVSSRSYDKQDYLNSEIVNFPFLDGDVRRSFLWCIFLHLIRFVRVSSNVSDFNNRNQ